MPSTNAAEELVELPTLTAGDAHLSVAQSLDHAITPFLIVQVLLTAPTKWLEQLDSM